jgi:ribA/ribD-fused uncharacterized protein
MNYDLNTIQALYDAGMNFKYLFFWGHTPKIDQKVGAFCFSQWYPSPFVVDNKTYQTSEHWMMAEKARLFKDYDIEEQIIKSQIPGHVKDLGRQINGFDEDA